MSDSEDDSQKTEEPSEKRLRDALERGQVVFSKELNNFIIFLAWALIIATLFPYLAKKSFYFVKFYIENSYQYTLNDGAMHLLMKSTIIKFLLIIIPTFSLIIVIAIISSFVQMGTFVFSTEPITPKLEKLSPMKGLGRMFSFKSLVEFIKGIFKITLVGVAIYMSTKSFLPTLNNLYNYDIYGIIAVLFKLIKNMLMVSLIIIGFIAIFDYFYQRYEYFKSLRMSKQDLKEEYKQMEGSPEIKAKLRRIRNERSRQRMMQSVPNASVIITNPTHYSVALQYDSEKMDAPKLIAKGQDIIALKIREIAEENKIPIVENPPLCRSLYTNVDIDQEIPFEYYKAVAEVINYVMSLKKKKF